MPEPKTAPPALYQWVVVLALALAYAIGFEWLLPRFGDMTRAFSLSYVCAAAWYWGMWAGMGAALFNLGLNFLLYRWWGVEFSAGLLGVATSLLVGGLLGWLSDLRRRLAVQMDLQQATAQKLRAAKEKLEETVAERTAELRQKVEEHRQAKQALEESQEAYRCLVEGAPSGIFMARVQDGRLIHLNRRVLEMFGYSQEEALRLSIWDVTAPEHHQNIRQRLAQREQGDLPASQGQVYNCLRKDGSPMRCEIWVSLVKYQGQPVVQGLLRDVGQSELLERQLRHAQKMEAVGKLSSGVAHDFNNILQALTGYLQLLDQRLSQDSLGRRYVRESEQAVARAAELVRRLLTFSRKAELQFQPLDLNQEVEGAVAMLRRTIPKMIAMETQLHASQALFQGDGSQITQLLMNLAHNAVDAMPEGGVLTLRTANQHLDQEFCQQFLEAAPGDYLRLEVSDTGTGVPPDIRKNIFDPFFTTKEVGKGTGLGLSIVYGVVKSHRGIIQMDSSPPRGTIFRIYLPRLSDAQTPPLIKQTPPEQPLEGKEHILLVDDEDPILEVGRHLLEKHGYRVTCAHSGEEALALYDELRDRLDLVLLDLGMPGMGGIKALEALLIRNPRVKVVICSGYAAKAQAQEVIQAGAAGFVAKPYNSRALLGKLRQILDEPPQE